MRKRKGLAKTKPTKPPKPLPAVSLGRVGEFDSSTPPVLWMGALFGRDPGVASAAADKLGFAIAEESLLGLRQLFLRRATLWLRHAIVEGRAFEAGLLVDAGAPIGGTRRSSPVPIVLAAEKGQLDVARVLLDRTADINSQDSRGWSALRWAVKNANLEAIELFLGAGADVHVHYSYGSTVLHHAAWAGTVDVVARLVQAGANVHARDKKGRCPLHLAARKGRGAVAELLLQHGAEINAECSEGGTPLWNATRYKREDLAAMLRSRGAIQREVSEKNTRWTSFWNRARCEEKLDPAPAEPILRLNEIVWRNMNCDITSARSNVALPTMQMGS